MCSGQENSRFADQIHYASIQAQIELMDQTLAGKHDSELAGDDDGNLTRIQQLRANVVFQQLRHLEQLVSSLGNSLVARGIIAGYAPACASVQMQAETFAEAAA
jgi:hypothetical protein